MDLSPPGSSVHKISQARILEWVAFPSPGDLPNPGIKPRSPALQADSLWTELHIHSQGFPWGTSGKKPAWQWWRHKTCGFNPAEGNSYPLQYSCLQNSMDRGAWQATVHGAAKSQMPLKQLSVCISTFASPSVVAGSLSMWGLCDKQADFCPFQAWFYWQRHGTLLETKCFSCSVVNKLIHRQSAPSASFPFNPNTIFPGSLVDLLCFRGGWREKIKSLPSAFIQASGYSSGQSLWPTKDEDPPPAT